MPEPIWISLRGARVPTSRGLEARVFLRFPGLFRTAARLSFRLPRNSGARQAILRRGVLRSIGAWARDDTELGLIGYMPDAEVIIETAPGARLDMEPAYRGREGVRTFMQTFQDPFGELTYEPQWLIDVGENVLVMLLQHRLRGRASGVDVEQVSAHRLHIRDGLVEREEIHTATGHDLEPLARAVGLDPAPLLPR